MSSPSNNGPIYGDDANPSETSGVVKVFYSEDCTREKDRHWLITWNTTESTHSLSFKVTEAIHENNQDVQEMIADGNLKWDGCLNILFAQRCLHFCGPEDAPLLGRLIEVIYRLGPKQEHWSLT